MKSSTPIFIVLLISAASATGSDDPALTMACGSLLALTLALLWRSGEPPVLLFPAGAQLAQVVAPTFYANLLGLPVQDVSLHVGDIATSTWFALLAMLALVAGLWCGQRGSDASTVTALHREARTWSPQMAFRFCSITVILAAAFELIAELFGGLAQPALAASGIQWVGIFVLTCVCTAQQRGHSLLVLVTGFKVVQGFIGYFSSFRLVFYVLLLGIFSARARLRSATILAGLTAGGMLLFMAIWWSAIKFEYRNFLDHGSKQQVVLVSLEERLSFLANKLSEVDGQAIGFGFDRLIQRVGYVDYLAAVMRNVPSNLPFQKGAQIGEAVAHVVQPRLFFPDKPPLPSDTVVLEKYTGLHFGASTSEGTSISMGYLAELYIDFGQFGATGAMFVFGLLAGRAFRVVCAFGSLPAIVNYGLASMLAMTITQFEVPLIKLCGSFVSTFVVALLLKRFFLRQLLTMAGISDQRERLALGAH